MDLHISASGGKTLGGKTSEKDVTEGFSSYVQQMETNYLVVVVFLLLFFFFQVWELQPHLRTASYHSFFVCQFLYWSILKRRKVKIKSARH